MLDGSWLDSFWMPNSEQIKLTAETLKIFGALASFYAVWKLRDIEKKYLFKATIPGLVVKISASLDILNAWLIDPNANEAQLSEALYRLLADVKSARVRTRGSAKEAAEHLMAALLAAGIQRSLLQRWIPQLTVTFKPSKTRIIEILGNASGLVRSLEHELDDATWSSK